MPLAVYCAIRARLGPRSIGRAHRALTTRGSTASTEGSRLQSAAACNVPGVVGAWPRTPRRMVVRYDHVRHIGVGRFGSTDLVRCCRGGGARSPGVAVLKTLGLARLGGARGIEERRPIAISTSRGRSSRTPGSTFGCRGRAPGRMQRHFREHIDSGFPGRAAAQNFKHRRIAHSSAFARPPHAHKLARRSCP